METGIKETLELLEGAKLLALAVKKVASDGKVDFTDLPVIMTLMKEVYVLTAAVEDVSKVVDEAKDLSIEELQTIGAKVVEIMKAVREA